MEEYDIFGNIQNGTDAVERKNAESQTDGLTAGNAMTADDVFTAFCSYPKLTTLLYENLPYLEIEAIEDALVFAATGKEAELLQLLAARKLEQKVL